MKKNIFWFLAGAITVFIIFISFIVFNNLKKENLPDSQQLANAYTELDRVLYIRAVSRFKNGDVKNSLEDMKTRESIRKLIHSKNEPYLKDKDEAVDCLTRLNDLNEKIKQNPNNYKLYYERANLKNKPTVSMFENDEQSFCSDFKSAIKDYSKVIELKPDLKEAYEKRADAIGMSINGISYNTSEKDKFDKLILDVTIQILSDQDQLNRIADGIMRAYEKKMKDTSVLSLLENERKETRRALENIMKAIESGIFNTTTQTHMKESEKQLAAIDDKIELEKYSEQKIL